MYTFHIHFMYTSRKDVYEESKATDATERRDAAASRSL